ncbi:MAG: PAS domain S-box protein [Halobacteriota archaeon]
MSLFTFIGNKLKDLYHTNRGAFQDSISIFVIVFFVFAFTFTFDPLHGIEQAIVGDGWDASNLFTVLLTLIIALSIFAVRRWDELLKVISEQKRVKKALEESESRYRTTFEHTGTAMVVIKSDTTLSMANEEFERLTGYNRDELKGKSWTDFVHPEDLDTMKKYHQARREGGEAPTSYEFRFINKRGDVRNIYINIDMIPNKGESVASLIDITHFKNLNKLLRVSSEINEHIARYNKTEILLKSVCRKLNSLYEAVFIVLNTEEGVICPASEGTDDKDVETMVEESPTTSKALEGETMEMDLTDVVSDLPHQVRYTISIPLLHDRNHGAITIYSSSRLSEEEVSLLKNLSRNVAFALSAYEVEQDKQKAMEQLAANLSQFNRSADRLRNPLAVILGSIEVMSDERRDEVLEKIKEHASRIKEELDVLRVEEIKTYNLTKKARREN